MSDWHDKALAMRQDGMMILDIAAALQQEMGARTQNSAYDSIRRYLRKQSIDLPPAAPAPAKAEMHVALENLTPARHTLAWDGCQTIRFGLISDSHINSKYTQITHLHRFYDICATEGIDTVFHTGDIDEGEQMRPGHPYECYEQGADDHVAEIVRVYPKRAGITTYFITGNHDASIYKRAGMDIGKAIATRRPDMVYLGRDRAIVNLTEKCTLELRHPWDGTSFAISHKAQKIIEAMPEDKKPKILAIGHYHKLAYLLYRDVHCFLVGCTQGPTPHTTGTSITPYMGGWVVEVQVAEDGSIRSITPTLIHFYPEIEADWKNWRVTI